MEKVTFIIPVHNSMPHIQATIDSLFKSTKHPFKLLIVESESIDGTKEYVNYLAKTSENIKVIYTKKEGTIKAINAGIREADKDSHIFLCHDDVVFFKWYMRDWLKDFVQDFEKSSDIGIMTFFNSGGISGPEYLEGFRWIGTWAVLIRNTVVDKLNREMFLDENFGVGYGDDIDMTYRILEAGYTIGVANMWIDHHRYGEHKNNEVIKDVEKHIAKNAKYFRIKHNLKKEEQ